MTMRVPLLALAAAFGAGTVPAPAQFVPQLDVPRYALRPDRPVILEGFVSHYRLAGGHDARTLDGFGGRILWPLARPASAEDDPLGPGSSLGQRVAVGFFAVHTPERDARPETWHYGAQADLHLTKGALAGRLEPLLSLGAGAFREDLSVPELRSPFRQSWRVAADPSRWRAVDLVVDPPETNSAPRSGRSTRAAVTPGVGVRLRLTPALAVRADARDVVVLGGAPRHNVELAAGISLRL
jgi:hypothetical protein